MPQVQLEFTVKASVEKAWELLSNMEALGLCVPGCKEVKKISEMEYDWVIEARLLHTTRTIYARTHATEITPPGHVSFSGEGKLREGLGFYKMTLGGKMDLYPVSGHETKVGFEGSVSAGGVGGAIINKIASGQMQELMRDFQQNIKDRLER